MINRSHNLVWYFTNTVGVRSQLYCLFNRLYLCISPLLWRYRMWVYCRLIWRHNLFRIILLHIALVLSHCEVGLSDRLLLGVIGLWTKHISMYYLIAHDNVLPVHAHYVALSISRLPFTRPVSLWQLLSLNDCLVLLLSIESSVCTMTCRVHTTYYAILDLCR